MEEPDGCGHDFIKDVMASMGWQNSFVPIISESNKELLDNIKCLGTHKLDRIDALDAQEKEAQRVQNDFTSADYEFDQSLKLLTAHKSQYSTEHHLYKLSEHEESKFKQILKDTVKSHKELTQQQESLKGKKLDKIVCIGVKNSFRSQLRGRKSMNRSACYRKEWSGRRARLLSGVPS